MLLAGRWVYSTKVGVSCSTDNPWPVQPQPRAVAGLKGLHLGAEADRAPPGAGRGAVDVQICDKGSGRSHPDGAKPHDSKVFIDAAWGLEVLCHRSGLHRADAPEDSGAADLPGRLDQRAAAAGTMPTRHLHRSGWQRRGVLIVPVPGVQGALNCWHSSGEIEHRSSLVPPAARPVRASEVMTPAWLRSEETRLDGRG